MRLRSEPMRGWKTAKHYDRMGEARVSMTVRCVPNGVSRWGSRSIVTREARICRLWTLAGRCLASVLRGAVSAKLLSLFAEKLHPI